MCNPNEKFKAWSGSKYFKPRTDPRLKCRCCGMLAPSRAIIVLINEIREEFERKVLVNSGTRCTKYNAKIKGADQSYHIAMPSRGVFSNACDIRPGNPNLLKELHRACLRVLDSHGGCKLYSKLGFIHVDTRPGRWRARG